jgi:hypothetical protein
LENLNDFFSENSIITAITGLFCFLVAVITLSKEVKAMLYKTFSSKQNISGWWVLLIYDNQGQIMKIDQYAIKQYRSNIYGKITRIYSTEDENQLATRQWSLKGYFRDSELVYCFSATHPAIHSYGSCNLKRSYDFEYKGFYYVPIGKKSKTYRFSKHPIKLTQNLSALKDVPNLKSLNISKKILKLPMNKNGKYLQ